MESLQLSNFYRSITTWPKSESELSILTDRLCKLLGEPPIVAALLFDDSQRQDVRFCSASGAENVSVDSVREYLRKVARTLDLSGQIKTTTLSGENLPWATALGVHHLATIPLIGEIRSTLNPREARGRREFGVLAVGVAKPLAAKEEILLLAASDRLAELAVIHHLENVVQMRSQFLSIASHELKTPLTSIYGVLQLQERILRLKKDEPAQVQLERQHSFLKMVIRQVERLNSLINDLLDVSRIQNGRFSVEPSETDVAALVREAVGTRLKVIAEEAGAQLQLEAPESFIAWVDPVRMEEVVTNLVMNAIRFSPEGGVVWIRLKGEDGSFRLSVRDQGQSMPMADGERIFQPFERAPRTSRLGGMGLGLFISRQIAQLHGGNVSLVESVPGKGNVFEANLPVRNVGLGA